MRLARIGATFVSPVGIPCKVISIYDTGVGMEFHGGNFSMIRFVSFADLRAYTLT